MKKTIRNTTGSVPENSQQIFKEKNHRLQWVDNLRGIAIVLMIVFHFSYDLRFFGWVDWSVPNGNGWWQFRYFILTLFIFTMGMSLSLTHSKKWHKRKFLFRIAQLGLAAAVVTTMSLFMFPSTWIYFGILHFLLAASLIGMLFVKTPTLALIAGIGILIGHWLGWTDPSLPFVAFNPILPQSTEDFVPFFPWLGVCFLGIAAGKLLPLQTIEERLPRLPKVVTWLGKHGLLVYLLHQPILFLILTPLSFIL